MKMKHILLSICFLLTFFSNDKIKSQSLDKKKIYINIQNIPVIKHKISTSKTSWKTDKSPTVTYRLKNDYNAYSIKYNKVGKKLSKTFDLDTVFLKLRYNPGKYQEYILRRGDSVMIEYAEGKPYIEILNRELKKHDVDVANILDQFEFPLNYFEFLSKYKRVKNDKEKREEIKSYAKIYTQQLALLDSLKNNDFLSTAEYKYYWKSVNYLKEEKLKKYSLEVLQLKDLHINSYQRLLRDYVFQNLKKKIISLGSGSARNSAEAFDFVFTSKNFTMSNRDFLLYSSLKNIKIDFPFAQFDSRYSKFKSIIVNKNLANKMALEFVPKLRSIHKKANTVAITDSNNNETSLSLVLQKHKGKVIYIDFWASWCAPCRASFPSYKALKEEYKNKNVVFLFISIDEDTQKWKDAEIKEGLTNSYLAQNYPVVSFYKDLQLKSVPRYLVFDKFGKLAHQSAPSPGSEEIRSLLNELLLQKQ